MTQQTPPIPILSRSSHLARLQVDEALPFLQKALPNKEFSVESMNTIGDRDLKTPLTDANIPTDFFSRDLDQKQLAGEADIVVHSAKDLPNPLTEGLVIAAMLPAQDTRDALVIRKGIDLNQGGIIGTSSPVREAAMRKIYPHTTFKSIRGSIGQRLDQLDAGDYDAVIIAGCALQRLGWEDRITEWLDYETTPLQGRLAITVKAGRRDLIDALRKIDVRQHAGLVAMVGCPSDARMLGGLARDLIQAADLILHDRLIPQEVLSLLGARGEYVGKKGHAHSTTQAHIHRRILHESEKGKLVVRLHGGEPGILGHLGETLDYCHAWGLRTEVIPAISAAQLTAARGQCSLTHRHDGRSITFLSGHKGLMDHEPAALSPQHGNLAIYMGVRDIATSRQRLKEAGWDINTPVTAGLHLGTPQEKLIHSTLEKIDLEALESPAVLLVGPRSYKPRYTLFTGTDPAKFVEYGPLLHFPMIALQPRPLPERNQILQAGLAKWQGIIFPSSPAVKWVMEALLEFADTRALAGKKILAVGPLTAKTLASYGLKADAVPEGFGGAAALATHPDLTPGVYGYLCSSASPVEERKKAFTGTGIELDAQVYYENASTPDEKLPELDFQRVLFTSSSTVKAYFKKFPEEKTRQRDWLVVGSSTLKALNALGLNGLIIS
ncbi:hydroxymethylbilane synthase [Kiritimatiellaeota bacterium B1221]|nr:hydroxymethylbilane synthase [Kiritimatiellaeota bacterium B1221]